MVAKRITLLFTLFFVGLPSVGFATETRLAGMGNPAGVADESTVFVHPQDVTSYSLALVELGATPNNTTDAYGGAMKSLGSSNLGLFVSRDNALMTRIRNTELSLVDLYFQKMVSNTDPKATLPAPENPIDFLYGLKLEGKKQLGFRLTMAGYKDSSKDTVDNNGGFKDKNEKAADQVDLGVGLGMPLTGGYLKTSANLGVIGTLETKTKTNNNEVNSTYNRGFSVDFAVQHNEKNQLGERYLTFGFGHQTPKVDVQNGANKKSKKFEETLIELGGGLILNPVAKTNIVFGLKLSNLTSRGPVVTQGGVGTNQAAVVSFSTTGDSIKRTSYLLASNLGLEAPVYEGLGVLAGMNYNLWGRIIEKNNIATAQPETEKSYPEITDNNLWALGLFYQMTTLRADATLERKFLYNGPQFISGGQSAPLLLKIAATYIL